MAAKVIIHPLASLNLLFSSCAFEKLAILVWKFFSDCLVSLHNQPFQKPFSEKKGGIFTCFKTASQKQALLTIQSERQ